MKRMTFEKFTEELVKKLQEIYSDREIYITTYNKNNGQVREGLSFRQDGTNISPIVYLNPFYTKYLNDTLTLSEAVDDIQKIFLKNKDTESLELMTDKIHDFSQASQYIFYVLVNLETNIQKMFMENLIYTPIEGTDLAIVYKVKFDDTVEGISTSNVTRQLLSLWGISEDELKQVAKENCKKLFPASTQSLMDFVSNMMNVDEPLLDPSDVMSPWIITNKQKIFGAGTVLYDGLLKELAANFDGKDLYLLPSSIHEMLAVPTNVMSADELRQMVGSVNAECVLQEDWLSDNVYRYIYDEDRICIA